MSITRRNLRELCMKIVFQYDFYPNPDLDAQAQLFLEQEELEEADIQMVLDRVKDIFTHIEELDPEIEACSDGWKLARMSKVDLSILRVAYYEMKLDPEVPVGVAINEAVEIAKIYSGDTAYQFINGVLSKLSKGINE